jgi:hypothetical protein
MHSRLALPEDGAVALLAAMRYVTMSALVSVLLTGLGFGQTTTGQHPAQFSGNVTRAVQAKANQTTNARELTRIRTGSTTDAACGP